MFDDPVVIVFLIPLTVYMFIHMVIIGEVDESLSDRLKYFVAFVVIEMVFLIAMTLYDLWLGKVIELVKEELL